MELLAKNIIGTISNCCQASVSTINGKYLNNGSFKPFHYICNKCGKETTAIKKPMWEITDKGKYKPIY